MSNKKLTTEEKIAKSRLYAENMEKAQNRLKDMREAKRKLDTEIAEELERAFIVNMQELGKHIAEKIGKGLSLEAYSKIIDSIFMIDEVEDFVKSEREKLKRNTEDHKFAETTTENATACSDSDSISA